MSNRWNTKCLNPSDHAQLVRMRKRISDLADRLALEANPELRDVADDLKMIAQDEDPT